MGKQEHKIDKRFIDKHVRTGDTEGGACLNRHISGVSRSSCSHRWQAIQRAANEDKSYYNKKPEWAVSESRFKKSDKPFWHQAHHIIPNAVLNDAIAQAADNYDIAVYTLLRAGWLEAKYNLNHKGNMIILPMEPRVSQALKLPRHLRPFEQSHENYSAMVSAKVQPIIDDYAKAINDARTKDKHPEPPDKLSKAKLMRVSGQMRAVILTWGRADPGPALEDHG